MVELLNPGANVFYPIQPSRHQGFSERPRTFLSQPGPEETQ